MSYACIRRRSSAASSSPLMWLLDRRSASQLTTMTVVVLSAIVPTVIAQRWFSPPEPVGHPHQLCLPIPRRSSPAAQIETAIDRRNTEPMLTLYGAAAVTFMMLMYAIEHRHRSFILAFGAGCLASSLYGFLAGTWPFGVVEIIWAAIALNRYLRNEPD